MDVIDISRREERPVPRRRSKKEILARRRRRRRRMMIAKTIMVSFVLVCGMTLGALTWRLLTLLASDRKANQETTILEQEQEELIRENNTVRPVIEEDFLTMNPYSRPGEPLETVKNIFVHYTANQGTSARQNRSYFENLGISGETSASAHFVIGYEGEIIQCLPLDEIGYAVKSRNYDSISIECCYLAEDGCFTDATYSSLVKLTAWLLNEYDLTPVDVLRHYDVGGKKCPLYFVENEDAWEKFRKDLKEYILRGKG